jgi:hypothetical protein
MRYVALEEAFSVPELEDRHPSPWRGFRFSQRHIADWARKLKATPAPAPAAKALLVRGTWLTGFW